jgi:SpoVK/Ycf46/Vps4 family AAA+-type ATPase
MLYFLFLLLKNKNNFYLKMLNAIIQNLETEYKKNNVLINVEKPKILIKALKELRDDVIGMDNVKDIIASSTLSLIRRSTEGYHTLIGGPPGVGKTKIAIIWAKIIFAIGVLDKTPINSPFDNVDPNMLVLACMTFMTFFQYFIKLGNQYSFKLVILIGIFLVCTYFIATSYMESKKKENIDDDSVEDREIISVVSREDFVASYVGQSAAKTKALLEKNIGKVLFIDEAYSLIPEGNLYGVDFGNEVLSTLNLFMSEHPTKIVVIFAGYADKITNSIFNAQPGFERRIKYTFNCEPYSLVELWKIFLKHFEKNGRKIALEDQERIYEEIIKDNYFNNSFEKGQAGDMQKLMSFCVERMIKRVTEETSLDNNYLLDIKEDYIRYSDVKNAMDSFNTNKLDKKNTGDKKKRSIF